jgi:hypothetical protein
MSPFQGLHCIGPDRSQGDALGCISVPFQGKENAQHIGLTKNQQVDTINRFRNFYRNPPKLSHTHYKLTLGFNLPVGEPRRTILMA